MPIPCPYCNATIRVPADSKVECPRCGESVSVPDGTPPDAEMPETVVESPPGERSNRAIGLTVAGVMVGLAALTLGYALSTTDFRRSNDNRNREETQAVTAVPPGELAGLGYLPTNVQVIAGVAVAQALESDSGRAILKSLSLAGFAPDEIDHIVLGISLDAFPPRTTMVVRTRRRLDLAKVRAALKAERGEQHGGRTVYRGRWPLKLPTSGDDGSMTFPDERTLVVAGSLESLASTPATPGGAPERFAPPVRDLIAQLPQDVPAWLVGHKDPNNATFHLVALALRQLPAEFRQGLQKLTSLSLSATERNGRLEVTARATGLDAAQAGAVRDAVQGIEVGRGTVDGTDPLTVHWSESAAELVRRLTPPR